MRRQVLSVSTWRRITLVPTGRDCHCEVSFNERSLHARQRVNYAAWPRSFNFMQTTAVWTNSMFIVPVNLFFSTLLIHYRSARFAMSFQRSKNASTLGLSCQSYMCTLRYALSWREHAICCFRSPTDWHCVGWTVDRSREHKTWLRARGQIPGRLRGLGVSHAPPQGGGVQGFHIFGTIPTPVRYDTKQPTFAWSN